MSRTNNTELIKENPHLTNAKREFYSFIEESSEFISQFAENLSLTVYMLFVMKASTNFKSYFYSYITPLAISFFSFLSNNFILSNGQEFLYESNEYNIENLNQYGGNDE